MAGQPFEVPPLGQGFGATVFALVPGGRHLSAPARLAVFVVAVGLAVLLAALWQPWGFILLGALTGVLGAFGVRSVQAGLRPLFDLGRAALPLVFPLLVFVAAGVINESFAIKFVVGLATLSIAWVWLISPDHRALDDLLNTRKTGVKRRRVLRMWLPGLFIGVALLFVVVSVGQFVAGGGDVSNAAFVIGVGFVAAGAVVRLLSYARNTLRTLVALALLVLLWRLAVEIGLFKRTVIGDAGIGGLAIVVGALLGLTALVEIATAIVMSEARTDSRRFKIAIRVETPLIAGPVTDIAALAGTALATLAAICMTFAVYDASVSGGKDESQRGAAPRESTLRTPPAQMSDPELAQTFAPVLAFSAGQRRPVPVDDYIKHASLRDWEGRTTTVNSLTDLNVRCPGIVKAPCYVLSESCAPGQDPADCAALLPDDKNAVYVRVARASAWSTCTREKPCADGSPDPFARAKGRYADQTKILVQYWFFYAYNDWSAPVAVGDLQEIHASDWEAVTVGLSETEPLWVAYSQHCGGSWSDWADVPVALSDPSKLRPLVAVAKGSQANYRLARATRVPNFAECSGIPKDLLRLVSYAANVRDRTDDAETWSPSAGDLRLVTAKTLPMSFPGEWAPFARMQLKNLRTEKRLGNDTPGPATPTYQRLWQTPMQTIFAGRGWKES